MAFFFYIPSLSIDRFPSIRRVENSCVQSKNFKQFNFYYNFFNSNFPS